MISMIVTMLYCNAQTTYITNGPQDETEQVYAYTHATIYINPTTLINNATLVTKKGKVIGVTANGTPPKNAIVIDLTGRTIYPAFVDLFSDYGITIPSQERKRQHGEQFNSNKPGAYSWNEALRAEIDATTHFQPDASAAKNYLEMGFAAVLTGSQDGICRGTTSLVSLAQKPAHFTILSSKNTASFSFKKGSSPQPYPQSLMGSIALIRQTYYDAAWYTQQQTEINISLETFAQLRKLPAIFDAGNKQNVLRAAAIGKEFGATYFIKTNGDEYQRINEIKTAGVPLIVPINFPKAYQIQNSFDAAYISTTDLKHWELAPANLYWLWKNGVKFCITANGCKPHEFLTNLRKAVSYGLPKEEAIKALTTTPANLINQNSKIGSLTANSEANFIITTGDLFDPSTRIIATVAQGQQHEFGLSTELKLASSYMVQGKNIRLQIKKNNAIIDGDTVALSASIQNNNITVSIKHKTLITFSGQANIIDSSSYPFTINSITGFAHQPQQTTAWVLTSDKETSTPKEREDKNKPTHLADSLIWFPFTDFGNATIPKQEKILFKNATVWTNEQQGISTQTDVIINQGKIVAVGKELTCTDCRLIDATSKHLTSGIIDEHSHVAISQGVNEGTQAVTSEVRIGDVVNADDINMYRQLAGGVVAAQLLHGSANPVGGQSALIKFRWGMAPEQLKIVGAPGYIKFALGENVKQANWGDQATTRYPQTRMGVEQVFVDAFTRARFYEQRLKTDKNTRRDLELDALLEVINGKRFITCHSYVQSEINMLMHVADTFGFKVNTFTHILEGYKVADKMKKHGVNASTFADWWAYKYEVMDAIPQNAGILHRMGVTVAINSDDAEMGRRLNHEAAKIIKYTNISEEDAWKMVTLNPAKMLRIDNRTGSIKAGKDADIVLWTANPLSIYAKPEMTFVDGICYYSLAQDEYLRKQVELTRERIIKMLLDAQENGNETQSFISEPEVNYHCND